MNNININDGFKEFTINNDPDKVIRFNPSDLGIIERINKAYNAITNAEIDNVELNPDGTPVDTMTAASQTVEKFRNLICEQIDYIFNSSVSEVVFGNQSPLSMVKGIPFYERFLNAVVPIIEKEAKAEQLASQKRMNKYTGQVK